MSLKLSSCYHPRQPCRHLFLCGEKGGRDRALGIKGWPVFSAKLLLRCFSNTEVLDLPKGWGGFSVTHWPGPSLGPFLGLSL